MYFVIIFLLILSAIFFFLAALSHDYIAIGLFFWILSEFFSRMPPPKSQKP